MGSKGDCSIDGCSETEVSKYLYVPHGESAMRLPLCERHAVGVKTALDEPGKMTVYSIEDREREKD